MTPVEEPNNRGRSAAPLTVGMVQSNYLPWKGYFDIINRSDRFIFYDDVQFTKEDWRNRNRIKTKDGIKWLTVPCGTSLERRICDVTLPSAHWQRKHWALLSHAYARAPHFATYRSFFEEFYIGRRWTHLSELNQALIRGISTELLGVRTEFDDSRNYELPAGAGREDRWRQVLQAAGASRFLIGPTARDYLDERKRAEIAAEGIELVWMDYEGYPEYPQLFPPFAHHVSIIDLIFNVGPRATEFMKSFPPE